MSGSSLKKKLRPVKMLTNGERKLEGIVAEGISEYYGVKTSCSSWDYSYFH